MIKVYVAGPYTKGDVVENVAAAIAAGNKLFDLGFYPYIPHLTHFWHFLHHRPYEDWLRLDLEWVLSCNAVLRLPGESSGADRETKHAEAHSIPVFATIEALNLDFSTRVDRERRAREAVNVTRGEFDQLTKVFRERIEALEAAGWDCGCGHANGNNLSTCAVCGRAPGATA